MANIGSTGPSRPLPSVGSPPVSPPLVTTPSTPPTPPSTPPLTPPRTGSGPPTIGSGTDQTGVQSSISSQSSGQISHTSSSVPVPSSLEVEDTRPVDFTSLLTRSGRLSHEELMTMVPSGIRDTFVPSSRIDRGSKYRWTDGTNYYEVKFHSSDRGAPRGSNSATGWTAQITVNGMLMTQRGQFRYSPRDFTHIPLDN